MNPEPPTIYQWIDAYRRGPEAVAALLAGRTDHAPKPRVEVPAAKPAPKQGGLL